MIKFLFEYLIEKYLSNFFINFIYVILLSFTSFIVWGYGIFTFLEYSEINNSALFIFTILNYAFSAILFYYTSSLFYFEMSTYKKLYYINEDKQYHYIFSNIQKTKRQDFLLELLPKSKIKIIQSLYYISYKGTFNPQRIIWDQETKLYIYTDDENKIFYIVGIYNLSYVYLVNTNNIKELPSLEDIKKDKKYLNFLTILKNNKNKV